MRGNVGGPGLEYCMRDPARPLCSMYGDASKWTQFSMPNSLAGTKGIIFLISDRKGDPTGTCNASESVVRTNLGLTQIKSDK